MVKVPGLALNLNYQMSETNRIRIALVILGIIAEALLLTLGFQMLSSSRQELALLSDKKAGAVEIQSITDTLRLQGQYRGACGNLLSNPDADSSFAEICHRRHEDLMAVYSDAAETGSWRDRELVDYRRFSNPVLFFNAMVSFNLGTIDTIKERYLNSRLHLDNEAHTFYTAQLTGLVLPALIEHLGVIRGHYGLYQIDKISGEKYYTEFGMARGVLQRLRDDLGSIDALTLTDHRNIELASRGADLSLRATEYLDDHTVLLEQEPSQPSVRLRWRNTSEHFDYSSELIDDLADYGVDMIRVLKSRLDQQTADQKSRYQNELTVLLLMQIMLAGIIAGLYKSGLAAVLAKQALNERMVRQQQMFGIIAHELRTPAAAINMLAQGDTGEDTLPAIRSTSRHLLNVIDDMRVTINPEEQVAIVITTFPPVQIVRDVAHQILPLLTSQNIQFDVDNEIDPALVVEIDGYRVRTILTNLLRNAFYHSGASHINFVARSLRDSENRIHLQFQVIDNGSGIDPSDWERLLQPFERGTSRASGTGVGLHIVNSWTELLGGNLTLVALDRPGTCIEVDFPVEESELPQNANSGLVDIDPAKLLENRTILLVEDDVLLGKLTKRLLEKITHGNVMRAMDGQEGLTLARQHRPALIVSDHFMPKMNGNSMISAIRDFDKNVPIIGITAATIGQESEDLINAGADCVLSKPATEPQLVGAIEALADRLVAQD